MHVENAGQKGRCKELQFTAGYQVSGSSECQAVSDIALI